MARWSRATTNRTSCRSASICPSRSFWKLFGITQFVPGTNGWAPGDGKRLDQRRPGLPAFIALICYEAIFSGDLGADPARRRLHPQHLQRRVVRRLDRPAQHAHHALLRAVETGLPHAARHQFRRDLRRRSARPGHGAARPVSAGLRRRGTCRARCEPHPLRPLRQLAVPRRRWRSGWSWRS